MGKNSQGINGNWKGKVGNNVGRISHGRTIISIYQADVRNPRTTKQQRQRGIFTLMVQSLNAFAGWAGEMMKGLTPYGTGWSNLIHFAFEDGVLGGTFPNWEIQWDKLMLSKGTLPLPYSPDAAVENGTLTVGWTDNSDMSGCSPNDVSCLLAYNPLKDQTVYTLASGTRSQRTATLTMPSAWSGDNVEVYFCMKSADGSNQSESVYLGNFSL